MNPNIETEDWKLGAYLDWRPKHHAEDCPRCFGRGEVGGGFKDLDGPRPCPECFGMKIINKGPTTPKPDIDPLLIEHMRRAWFDYNHKEKTNDVLP